MNKFDKFPKIYYINLLRAQERNAYMINLLNTYNLRYERVNGLDGLTEDVNTYCVMPYRNSKYINSFVIACTISHLMAIERFTNDTNNTDDFAIIAEDDLSFDFCKYWNFTFQNIIENAPTDMEILQLVCSFNESYESIKKMPISLFNYNLGYGFHAVAYLIRRDVAKKIIDKFFKYGILANNIYDDQNKYIADYIIYDEAITYTYVPSLLSFRDNNDSFIHTDHIINHCIWKEYMRDVWEKT